MERKINNQFYDELKEDWYHRQDHPIALLRAENAVRIPWISATLKHQFPYPVSLLDIGCGAGFLTNALSLEGHTVAGVDLSSSSLQIASQHDQTQKVTYLQANAYELPFPDASFDVACAMDVLEHVEEPQRLIAEASRVLKKGGLFFFHTFNRNPFSYLLIIKGVDWFVPHAPKNMHVYPLFIRPEELKVMCHSSHLHVEALHGFRPRLSLPFLKLLLTRKISPHFSFQFTKSLTTGYCGYAQKIKGDAHG